MTRFARGKQIIRSLLAPLRGDAEHLLQKKIFRVASRSFSLRQARFPYDVILPRGYGRGLPERVVELLLACLTYAPGKRVLDVGHSNIMECHKRLLRSLREPRHITGLDIAAPAYDTTRFYETSVMGDIGHPPFPGESFDVVWCISTLEHVGMDNSGYTLNYQLDEGADRQAVESLARLVDQNGCLLITVPFGRWEHHGWFRNYDRNRWNAILAGLHGRGEVIELFFHHDGDRGWVSADPSRLSDVGYFSQSNAGAAGLAAVLFFNRQAAGRRSPG